MPNETARFLRHVAFGCVFATSGLAHAQEKELRTVELYGPFAEWSAENPGVEGNPFDLSATCTFTHADSGETIETGLFHDGGDTWRWRFTGTRLGRWTFRTASGAPELDGITGAVEVEPNDDPHAFGFVTAHGTKWARPSARDGKPRAFVPQLAMTGNDVHRYTGEVIEERVRTFLIEHGFNGFHVPSVAGKWFDATGDERVERADENPDPRTFAALERLITRTHAEAGHVHIWVWGDAARGWTGHSLAGGLGGEEDRRLQRYIAARLGPLPGWSLGYGFDLDEWAGASDRPDRFVEPWRDSLRDAMGWPHFLGGRPEGPNRGTDHSRDAPWNVHLDYAGYEHHEPTYAVYVAALGAEVDGTPLGKPVLSEDRFRIREGGAGKDYTMPQIRRGLWISTLAGGVANIWGDLEPPAGGGRGSQPFDEPTWVETYARFWQDRHHDRFRLDSARANELTGGPEDREYALVSDAAELLVVYAEDTERIGLRLAALAEREGWVDAPLRARAVDTRAAYEEIDLGELEPVDQVLDLSEHGRSDWALVLTPDGQSAGASFRRGAVHRELAAEIRDAVTIPVSHPGGQAFACPRSPGIDDGGEILEADAVRLLGCPYRGNTAPARPHAFCGPDSEEDALACGEGPG